jgi:4'-phosphopantetheinyl transferase
MNNDKNTGQCCLLHTESSFRVDLSLLDVSEQALADPYAIELRQNIHVGIWEAACSTDTYLKTTSRSCPTREASDVQGNVSRFIKTNDKYLACASMLFKSRFFHEVYNDEILKDVPLKEMQKGDDVVSNTGGKRRRPVVELPRTEYRKPYIPLPSNWRNETKPAQQNDELLNSVKEEDVFSLSVSHQFPFVGLAKIRHEYQGDENIFAIGNTAIRSTIPPPIVGLDIVVFEKFNARLYSSEEEFLDVFRDQFTPNEWKNGIQNPKLGTITTTPSSSASMQMREFYVRWAIKEAYTKAIGVGMGLAFSSFEIELKGIDEDNKNGLPEASIWSRIRKNSDTIPTTSPRCFRGTITFVDKKEDDYFYFYFLPLASTTTDSDSNETIDGCACVCVGSFQGNLSTNENNEWKDHIDISWTDLERLVQSHENP